MAQLKKRYSANIFSGCIKAALYFSSCQTCSFVEITLAFLFVKIATSASILSAEVSPPAPCYPCYPCYPSQKRGQLNGIWLLAVVQRPRWGSSFAISNKSFELHKHPSVLVSFYFFFFRRLFDANTTFAVGLYFDLYFNHGSFFLILFNNAFCWNVFALFLSWC